MTSGLNLWDSQVWQLVLTLALLFGIMLLANTLRRLCGFLRRLMIPSSVLGGFLLLGLNYILQHFWGISLYSTAQLEILTYHGLGLGFAALSLRKVRKDQDGRSKTGALDAGLTVVNGYLLQATLGLVITILLFRLIGSFYASGVLLPMGYGQGPGQAFNWGHNFEAGSYVAPFENGFEYGTSFGLAVAALGFVSASIGGIIYLNRLRRKGLYKGDMGDTVHEVLTLDNFTGENEIPQAESLDKFTVQLGLVFLAYLLAYMLMDFLNHLLDPAGVGASGLKGTLQGMIWGFQFLFSSVFAILIRVVLGKLREKKIMHRDYTNNFMLDRISGFLFDLMVVASIAAIDLSAFRDMEIVLPLTLICLFGAIATYWYLRFVCGRVFPGYEHEAFLSLYGMLTGTASTGVILLRELDPEFRTQASDNIVYHMPWAILFGAPMFLLMGLAPQSPAKALLTLGVCAGLFVVFNILLLRRSIFKKKGDK